jgi:hypothetical protein
MAVCAVELLSMLELPWLDKNSSVVYFCFKRRT